MSIARVMSAQPGAIDAKIVTVEADSSVGLYGFTIVGLPGKEVDEAKDRVPAAIKNSGLTSPKKINRKVVVSLSPANLKKEGAQFDLPIAIAYLQAVGEVKIPKEELEQSIFLGELSLGGDLLPVKGVLSVAKLCKNKKLKFLFVPEENKEEAALVKDISVVPLKNLQQLVEMYPTKSEIKKSEKNIWINELSNNENEEKSNTFSQIYGQEMAKRALLIAATGGHNIALFGPPGTGKTMLAKAFTEILPELTYEESLEVTGIHSFSGSLEDSVVTRPPFRSPHHSASYVAIVGGGNNVKPGEITLAHKGVLFLDEFPEFDKKVLESLRQPLEDNEVVVSRAKATVKYPAEIILLAALNPCPCGFYGTKVKECVCKEIDLEKYKRKLSGPIVDRIDLWVEVNHVPYEVFSKNNTEIDKKVLNFKKQVKNGRLLQLERGKKLNSKVGNLEIKNFEISQSAEELWLNLAQKFGLSPRSLQKVKKVARTIADLDGSKEISDNHIFEAFQYRPKIFT